MVVWGLGFTLNYQTLVFCRFLLKTQYGVYRDPRWGLGFKAWGVFVFCGQWVSGIPVKPGDQYEDALQVSTRTPQGPFNGALMVPNSGYWKYIRG